MSDSDGRSLINRNDELFVFDDTKLEHDRYEVFVNNKLIGHKTLQNQGEQLSDIDDFLKQSGYNDFSAYQEGDHYLINAKGQDQEIVNALQVYFQNR